MLCEGCQVAVTGETSDVHALFLNRFGKVTNTRTRDVLGAEIFVNNDDGKTKFHPQTLVEVVKKSARWHQGRAQSGGRLGHSVIEH